MAQLKVVELKDHGLSAAQIHDELARYLQKLGRKDDLPSRRTIERMVRDLETNDASGPWSLGDPKTTADEARFVPHVWAEVTRRGANRNAVLTRREAQIVTLITTAEPELHPWDMWRLAQEYLRRETHGIDTADLDFLIGSASAWLGRGLVEEHRKQARREHFVRHREEWPDREYIYLTSVEEPEFRQLPSAATTLDRLGRGEAVNLADRDADDFVYFLAVLRAQSSASTKDG